MMRKNVPVPINNCKKKKDATQLPRNLAHNRKKVSANESKTTTIILKELDTTKNLSLL